jgi:hypothetical protein
MKRLSIVFSLIVLLVAIPYAFKGGAVANDDVAFQHNSQHLRNAQSAHAGQVWSLSGDNLDDGYFVIQKVERVRGRMVVHGVVYGQLQHHMKTPTYVDGMPMVSLTLGAFNQSVTYLVGKKQPFETFEIAYEDWISKGAPIYEDTIALLSGELMKKLEVS